MKRATPQPKRRPDDLLAMLRRLAARLGRTPRAKDVEIASPRAYRELYLHFDTFPQAIAAADLAPVAFPRKWTRERIVSELRKLDAAGYTLSRRRLADRGRRDLVNAAFTYWGGMIAARRAAGLAPPPRGRRGKSKWSPQEVIDQIKELRQRGASIASTRAPRMLRDAAIYYLGSWQDAVERAGFDYERTRLRRINYSKREVLVTLRKLAESRPRMTMTQVHRHRIKSGVERNFGTLEAALRAAKIRDWPVARRRRRLTHEETLAAIRRRHAKGRPMRQRDVARDDPHLHRAAAINFRGWKAALKAARTEAD